MTGTGMLRRLMLAATLTLAAPVAGQDDLTGSATRSYLLDDLPNRFSVLPDQWRPTLRPERYDADRGNYGMLADSATPRPITLTESIALALEYNTGLRIARLNPIAATAAVRNAFSQFDPTFLADTGKSRTTSPVGTLSPLTNEPDLEDVGGSPYLFTQEVNWNFGLRKRSAVTGGLFSLDFTNQEMSTNPTVINLLNPDYITALNLSVTQPLLRDFGWRFSMLVVDIAQIGEQAAQYDYEAQVAALVENVERAYWTYVLAIENVRVEERGLELARELLRQNQGRFNVGALPRTAVLESEAEVARREANLVRSTALERIARDNLRALINARDESAGSLLMIEPADRPTVVPVELDLDASLRTAYTQRPELIAARLGLDSRRIERRIAENQLLPRLDLVGSIGLNGLGGDNARVPTPVPPNEPFGRINPQVLGGYGRSLELLTDGRYYQYLIGARIEIPIANAAAEAQYAQARVNAEQARLSLEQLEQTVTLEITQAVNNLRALRTGIDATRVARELAEENVRNQQARYDVGLATTKDLIDFQDRLTQAERAEIESLAAYNIELARLRFSEGTLLERRNIVLDRPVPDGTPWWARF